MTDLKTFVSETIKQILEGTIDAGHHLKNNIDFNKDGYFQIGDGRMQKIDFDISVTTSESTKSEGRAGVLIKVLDFGINGSENIAASSVNKIKFSVPVAITKMANKNYD